MNDVGAGAKPPISSGWRKLNLVDLAAERWFARLTAATGVSPGSLATWLTLLGGGLIGTLYWLFVLLVGPAEPLRISILYRFGDTDYLPLIYALARGQYGEIADFATYGRGFMPFPLVSIAPYSLAIAVAGDAGFVLADFAVGAIRALILQRMFLLLSRRPLASMVMALVAVVVLFDLNVWSYRLPRPYLTEIFYILGFYLCLRLWLKRGGERWTWAAAHGMVIAATVQGDLHGGVVLGIAAALTLLATAWRCSGYETVLRYGLSLGCGFVALVLPFLIQASTASKQVLTRWGSLEHARTWEQPLIDTSVLPIALAIAVIPLLYRRGEKAGRAGEGDAAAAVGLLFILAAMIASTVFVGVLGRSIQIYQFYEKLPQIAIFAVVVTIVCVILQRVRSPILLGSGLTTATR